MQARVLHPQVAQRVVFSLSTPTPSEGGEGRTGGGEWGWGGPGSASGGQGDWGALPLRDPSPGAEGCTQPRRG